MSCDNRLDQRWCLADAMYEYCSEQAPGNPTDLCRRLFLRETGGPDTYQSGESEES